MTMPTRRRNSRGARYGSPDRRVARYRPLPHRAGSAAAERTTCPPRWTDDREHLAGLHLHVDVADQNLVDDSAGEILGFDRYGFNRPVRRVAVSFFGRIFCVFDDRSGFDGRCMRHVLAFQFQNRHSLPVPRDGSSERGRVVTRDLALARQLFGSLFFVVVARQRREEGDESSMSVSVRASGWMSSSR